MLRQVFRRILAVLFLLIGVALVADQHFVAGVILLLLSLSAALAGFFPVLIAAATMILYMLGLSLAMLFVIWLLWDTNKGFLAWMDEVWLLTAFLIVVGLWAAVVALWYSIDEIFPKDDEEH